LLSGMQAGGSAQPLGVLAAVPQGLTTQVEPAGHDPFAPHAGNCVLGFWVVGKNVQLKSASPRAHSGVPPGKVLKHWQVPWKQDGAGRAALPQKNVVPLPQVVNWPAAPVQLQLPVLPLVHCPIVQVWPAGQAAHVTPRRPQAALVCWGFSRQRPFRQQPVKHWLQGVAQVWLMQDVAPVQAVQGPPPVPQAGSAVPG